MTWLSDRRGSAAAASSLYAETAESIDARERAKAERCLAKPLGADVERI